MGSFSEERTSVQKNSLKEKVGKKAKGRSINILITFQQSSRQLPKKQTHKMGVFYIL